VGIAWPDWGLIVPVHEEFRGGKILGLARGIQRYRGGPAQETQPDEVQAGTFAITNPGVDGGLMGLTVINQTNRAILGIRRHSKAAPMGD